MRTTHASPLRFRTSRSSGPTAGARRAHARLRRHGIEYATAAIQAFGEAALAGLRKGRDQRQWRADAILAAMRRLESQSERWPRQDEARLGWASVDLQELSTLSAMELAAALDTLGVQRGWAFGDTIRAAAESMPDTPPLPEPQKSRSQAFQNLVVGRIAERVFRENHLAPLERDGFTVADLHERGENRDYALLQGDVELPINVKVASTLFRKARETVGLDPEDCVPISAYKAIGASERVPTLVYVDLVDFSLRERVDAFVDQLEGDLAIGWHLLSWYVGRGSRKAQDQFVSTLFLRHDQELKALAPGSTSFRVISARRVLAIMRDNPRRVPGLGIKAAGTGGFNAEVNVHISVRDETQPWDDVADLCRREGIQHVLDQITRTSMAEVYDPQL